MGKPNKYKKLVSNTFIFAIGTFSSKALVFLLMPLYTRVLTKTEFGIVDLIIQTSNLAIPVITLGITTAVIRFGLDKAIRKSNVFTTGIITILCGFGLFLLFMPLISKITFISDYVFLVYVFVFTSSIRGLCSQFVRAKQYTRLYALDGICSTITMILFNILLLVIFKMGIIGYVLAIVCSDVLSIIFLFIMASLHKYILLKFMKMSVSISMIKYAIPLIPTTLFWWVTNASDRYIVTYMVGAEANGLYAASYKIPTLIILISSVFIEAWQVSSIGSSTKDKKAQSLFFSNVCGAYQSIIFLTASILILFSKFITIILVDKSYYLSWQYIPFLVMATTFSCLVTFLGTVYMAEKKSTATLITTILGAVVNIIMNLVLIPFFGVYGAAFATFLSYFVVFIIRAIDTRKYVKIYWNIPKLILNVFILLSQCFIIIFNLPYWILCESLLCIIVFLLNAQPLLIAVLKLLKI